VSALAALSYLNLYFLLSSLYIISRLQANFPFPPHHSISLDLWVKPCCPPVPRRLSSFDPPLISSLVLLPTCWNYRGFHYRRWWSGRCHFSRIIQGIWLRFLSHHSFFLRGTPSTNLMFSVTTRGSTDDSYLTQAVLCW